MNFQEKLRLLIDRRGWTNREFAKNAGIAESQASKYLSGVTSPYRKRIVEFAGLFNVDPEWLSGEQDGLIAAEDEAIYDSTSLVRVPFYSDVRIVGDTFEAPQKGVMLFPKPVLNRLFLNIFDAFSFKMPDDSMGDAPAKTDILLLDSSKNQYGYRAPYMVAHQEYVYVCHVVPVSVNRVALRFNSDGYENFEASRGEIKLIALLRHAQRDYTL